MRNKSPLILGQSEEGMFAASDPLALADLTNEFIFLEDGDVAEVSVPAGVIPFEIMEISR